MGGDSWVVDRPEKRDRKMEKRWGETEKGKKMSAEKHRAGETGKENSRESWGDWMGDRGEWGRGGRLAAGNGGTPRRQMRWQGV